MASKFRYIYREKCASEQSVYRLWFGRKYFIWKCKALHQSVDNMAKDIDRGLRLGLKEGHLLTRVIHHIKYARIVQMEVEVLEQSSDAASLLVLEHTLLAIGAKDELCLNLSAEVHLPGWIPQTAVAEYRKRISLTSKKANTGRNKTLKSSGEGKGSSAKKNPPVGQLLPPRKAAGKKMSSKIGLKNPEGTKKPLKKAVKK